MRNLLLLLLITLLFSNCTQNQEYNETVNAYNDILPDLIKRSHFLNEFSLPPPPPENGFSDTLTEIEYLKSEIEYLYHRVYRLEENIQKPKIIRLYNHFLDFDISNFQTTELSTIHNNCCDTTWIDSKIIENYVKQFNRQILPSDISIENYTIELIENLPKIDSIKYYQDFNPNVQLTYLQLSHIVFNRTKDRGIFYYGVINKERISSDIRFLYIRKYDNRWYLR